MYLTSGGFYGISWPQPLGFSLYLLDPYSYIANHILLLLMQSFFYYIFGWYLVLIDSKHVGKRAWYILFCAYYWVILGYILLFQTGYTLLFWCLNTALLSVFCHRTDLGYSEYVNISAIWQNSWHMTAVSFHVEDSACYSLSSHVLFLARPMFVPADMHNVPSCITSFRVTCWMFVILQHIYFILFNIFLALHHL